MTDEVRQEDREVAEMFRRGTGGKYDRDVEHLAAALARHASPLRTRIAELEVALAPFALLADSVDNGKWFDEAGFTLMHHHEYAGCVTLAALRSARATLNGEKKHG